MSSSVIPTARSMARAGARWSPSVTSVLRGLRVLTAAFSTRTAAAEARPGGGRRSGRAVPPAYGPAGRGSIGPVSRSQRPSALRPREDRARPGAVPRLRHRAARRHRPAAAAGCCCSPSPARCGCCGRGCVVSADGLEVCNGLRTRRLRLGRGRGLRRAAEAGRCGCSPPGGPLVLTALPREQVRPSSSRPSRRRRPPASVRRCLRRRSRRRRPTPRLDPRRRSADGTVVPRPGTTAATAVPLVVSNGLGSVPSAWPALLAPGLRLPRAHLVPPRHLRHRPPGRPRPRARRGPRRRPRGRAWTPPASSGPSSPAGRSASTSPSRRPGATPTGSPGCSRWPACPAAPSPPWAGRCCVPRPLREPLGSAAARAARARRAAAVAGHAARPGRPRGWPGCCAHSGLHAAGRRPEAPGADAARVPRPGLGLVHDLAARAPRSTRRWTPPSCAARSRSSPGAPTC